MGTVLITGASAGLGEGMARLFAERGYDLALAARRLERLEVLRDEIVAQHPQCTVSVHALDVTDTDAVFAVFDAAAQQHGGLQRVIVNAGLGKGARLGTGRFEANLATVQTNVVGALAQAEAALQIFRAAGGGHLVFVSSLSALRGMPGSMTVYAATKAMLVNLAEGIRSDLMSKPELSIAVTTLLPGYIESEMNSRVEQKTPGMVDTMTGCRAMVNAIEAQRSSAIVPARWRLIGVVLRHAPLQVVRRIAG